MMKQCLTFLSIFLTLYPFAFGGTERTDVEKKTKLDFYLSEIHDDSRTGRFWGGGILIGIGAIAGVGALTLNGDDNRDVRIALGVTSVVTAGIGTLVLVLPSEREKLPEKYLAMPTDSAELLKARVSTGESHLEHLADKEKIGRYWGAGMMGLLAISDFALAATKSGDSSNTEVYMINGVLFTGLAAVTFFIKRPAERYLDSYKTWIKGDDSSSTTLLPDSVNFGLVSGESHKKSGVMQLSWNLN